jgi:hypothetical protein
VHFECAVADVLPTPEMHWPSMDGFEAVRWGTKVECDWNHESELFLEAFALRRLPRLQVIWWSIHGH